jgi:transposase-like protein
MLTEFKSIIDLLKAFPDEQSCIDHLTELRWHGNVVSPLDPTSKVYACAGNKYRCKNTGKYFNVRTNSIFDCTRIPLQKWFLALYIFSSHKKGISSHQLAKDITVTQKTAWFILHRLRHAFGEGNIHLSGIIEIDETFVGGEAKNKHENKKVKNERGGTISTKAPVLGMMERGGKVVAQAVPTVEKKHILPVINNTIPEMAILMTDQYNAYNGLDKKHFHESVNHSAKEFVRGMVHTNGIENFWSHLQRGVTGIYHHVSMEHLNSYVTEYTLRYNTRKNTTNDRFNVVLANANDKRLTYETLISKNNEQ